MIQVFVNNGARHENREIAYDSRLEEYDLLELSRTGGLNKGGTATITMPPGHPAYNLYTSYRTVVEIYRDGRRLFRGRALYPTDNYNNERTITCEGELCFFRDGVSRPYLHQDTPAAIFTAVIEEYNEQVEFFKQFVVGEITVTDPNDYIVLESESAESTLDTLDKLVERCGGYITFTTDEYGWPVVNWYAELNTLNNQVIEFGENMLDFARDGTNTDLCTAVLPYGAKLGETDRVTIASVNGGLDYIKDEAAAAIRGTIYHYPVWDDVTKPANLLTKARKYLEEHRYYIDTLKLTALDLSSMDKTLACFYEGDTIRVKSAPHAVDEDFQLSEMSEDLLNPAKGSITLGKQRKTMTGSTVAGDKRTEQIVNSYNVNTAQVVQETERRLTTQIEQTSTSILQEVSNTYATKESLTSSIKQLADSITLEVSGGLGNAAAIRLNVNGDVFTETLDLSQVRAAFAADTTSILLEAGTITFNSGTIVINSSYFTLDSEGYVTATGGTIGGWTLENYKLYAGDGVNVKTVAVQAPTANNLYVFAAGGTSHDSYADCPFRVTKAGKLYATDAVVYGDIITIDGSYKTELDRGSLRLYYDDALCGTINTKYWSGASAEGVSLRIEEGGKYIMFSHPSDAGTGYDVDYYLNYGWSTNYDEKHIFQTSARFLDKVYFSGSGAYFKGIYLYDNNFIRSCDSDGNVGEEMLGYSSSRVNVGSVGCATMLRGTTVYLKNTSTTVTSDRNAKNSIEELPAAYEALVDALTPVRFKYNEGTSGRYHVGFIAQDVAAALETAGLSTQDFAGYVDIDFTGELGLQYTEFIAILLQKIKRLEQRVSALQVAQ